MIFDRNAPVARLIRIRYIISEERFRGLPDDEKRLWHSHHYEVKSGELVAPGVPDLAELAYLMGLTEDGQVNETLVHDRDRRLGVSSSRKRQKREDIPWPTVVPGANSWESGRIVQTSSTGTNFNR